MSLNHILIQPSTLLTPRVDALFRNCYADNFSSSYTFNGLVSNSTATADMTSNTSIIQAALTAGGRNVLPAGTFYINSTLTIASDNTELWGQSMNTTCLKFAAANTSVMLQCVPASGTLDNVIISNLKLDGNAANRASGNSLLLTNCANCEISDVWFYCAATDSINIASSGGQISSLLSIHDCLFQYPLGNNIDIGASCSTILISNNRLEWSTGSNITAATCDMLEIVNNAFYWSNSNHLNLSAVSRSLVDGNVINRCSNDCILLVGALDCVISNNELQWANQANNSSALIDASASSLRNLICDNTLFENDATVSDSFVGPNGTTYLAKAFNVDIGIEIDSGCNYNKVYDNIVSTEIAAPMTDAGTGTMYRLNSNLGVLSAGAITSANTLSTSITNTTPLITNTSSNANSQTVLTLGSDGNNYLDIKGSTSANIRIYSPVADTVDMQIYTTGSTYGFTSKSDLNFYDSAFANNLFRVVGTGGWLVPAFATPQYTGYSPSEFKSFMTGTVSLTVGNGAAGAAVTVAYKRTNSIVTLVVPSFSVTLDALATSFRLNGLSAFLATSGVGSSLTAASGAADYIDYALITSSNTYIIINVNYPALVALGAVAHVVVGFSVTYLIS